MRQTVQTVNKKKIKIISNFSHNYSSRLEQKQKAEVFPSLLIKGFEFLHHHVRKVAQS